MSSIIYIINLLIILVLSISINCLPVDDQNGSITKYPFILIPGDGGNRLYAKLDKKEAPQFYCKKKTDDYFLLWLSIEEILPLVVDCFVDNIKLNYDNVTRKSSNTPGVDIKILDFGQTESVEYLDSFKISPTVYFANIVQSLVKTHKYVKGKNIRGAPYDWRKAPNELQDYYANLTQLVEETYEINGQTKVILTAHSLGNLVTLYWLNNYVNQTWKDKYIRSFVSLAAPWGGSTKAFLIMASGYNLGIPFINPLTARIIQRASMANIFLMPTDKFWDTDEVILSRPGRNYTVKDYQQFFSDLNFEQGYEIHKDTKDLIYDLSPPNVEVHSLYGYNVSTGEKYLYNDDKSFPDTQPKIITGNGDGTVNYRSLIGYKRWIDKQPQPIKFQEFNGVEHVDLLKYQPTIKYILNLLNN